LCTTVNVPNLFAGFRRMIRKTDSALLDVPLAQCDENRSGSHTGFWGEEITLALGTLSSCSVINHFYTDELSFRQMLKLYNVRSRLVMPRSGHCP
jgi:hypothetical protein